MPHLIIIYSTSVFSRKIIIKQISLINKYIKKIHVRMYTVEYTFIVYVKINVML